MRDPWHRENPGGEVVAARLIVTACAKIPDAAAQIVTVAPVRQIEATRP